MRFHKINVARFIFVSLIAMSCHYYIYFGNAPGAHLPVFKWLYLKGGYFTELFFLISGFFAAYHYQSACVPGGEICIKKSTQTLSFNDNYQCRQFFMSVGTLHYI